MVKFMNEAIKEAQKGIKKDEGGPFGCVIIKDNKIIAKAHNQVVKNNDPTCHAEINAIRKACKKLKTFDLADCEIYTTGYPCPMCMCAILWANINKIFYGCSTLEAEDIGFRDKIFEENIEQIKEKICKNINHKECLALFNEYKKIDNKTKY